MAVVKIFEYGEDEEYGGYGFKPIWLKTNMVNAGDGRLVAHDALEHMIDNQGGMAGEFMALGAVVFGRGLYGGLRGGISDLRYDMRTMLDEFSVGRELKKPPITRNRTLADGRFIKDEIRIAIKMGITTLIDLVILFVRHLMMAQMSRFVLWT